MADYLKTINDHRAAGDSTAATPVFYEGRRMKKLRGGKKRASLSQALRKAKTRKTGRGKAPPSRKSPMARKRKQTPKQRAASLRNLRKARRARGQVKSPRRRARAAAAAAAPKRRRPRRAKAAAAAPKRRRARAASPKRRRKKAKEKFSKRRKARRAAPTAAAPTHKRRRHGRKNPLDGMEIFVGGLTVLAGFFIADGTDRFLATHALGTKVAATATSSAVYMDQPSQNQPYPGLYNGAAIEAPMNALRWGVGAGITVVPYIFSHFVKNKSGRSALQMFAFGAGTRILGKGLVDLSAFLMKKTQLGQRLYPAELQAMVAANPKGATATALPNGSPSVGLAGAKPGDCAPCAEKKQGMAGALPPPPPPPLSASPTFGNMPAKQPAMIVPAAQTSTTKGPWQYGALYKPGMTG